MNLAAIRLHKPDIKRCSPMEFVIASHCWVFLRKALVYPLPHKTDKGQKKQLTTSWLFNSILRGSSGELLEEITPYTWYVIRSFPFPMVKMPIDYFSHCFVCCSLISSYIDAELKNDHKDV
ncbi:hypothetical protein Dimus_016012 [Dionaea muscipula]